MDYEKKYKEALERARICHKDMSNLDGVTANMAKDFFEEVFPELAESEDERIRKHIISVLEDCWQTYKNIDYDSSRIQEDIAWLEKQGEQKSAWSEDDKRMFDYALNMIEWYGGKNEKRVRLVSDWLKSLKQRIGGK